jgi:hypothetical protein
VAQMEKDPQLREAVQIVGVHAEMPSAHDTTGARVAAMNKSYWESEVRKRLFVSSFLMFVPSLSWQSAVSHVNERVCLCFLGQSHRRSYVPRSKARHGA